MKKFFLIMMVFLAAFIISCKKQDDLAKPLLLTSIYPLYDMVSYIAGDVFETELLLPPGVEPHSFEPTPSDHLLIHRSHALFYLGDTMEPWVKTLVASVDDAKVFKIGEQFMRDFYHEEKAGTNERESHHHEGRDPHVWLDFALAQQMAHKIYENLIAIMPSQEELFRENLNTYVQMLQELDDEYKRLFDNANNKTFAYAGHFSFAYMAARYDINFLTPFESFSPNAEPSPAKIMQLVDEIKEKNINIIFYEELLNPRLAQMISQESGIKMDLLHGAHNITKKERNDNVRFIDIMRENLMKLEKAMQ